MKYNKTGAVFSDCRDYRYLLWREWENYNKDEYLSFIGLNPSTADEDIDDSTIRRCIGFAIRLGYKGIKMLNIFAFRSTDPRILETVPNPEGIRKKNDTVIKSNIYKADAILCWGNGGRLNNRGDDVITLVKNSLPKNIWHFGMTKQGQPKHPLYLKGDTKLCLLK